MFLQKYSLSASPSYFVAINLLTYTDSSLPVDFSSSLHLLLLVTRMTFSFTYCSYSGLVSLSWPACSWLSRNQNLNALLIYLASLKSPKLLHNTLFYYAIKEFPSLIY